MSSSRKLDDWWLYLKTNQLDGSKKINKLYPNFNFQFWEKNTFSDNQLEAISAISQTGNEDFFFFFGMFLNAK